jgi:hypothetical protein
MGGQENRKAKEQKGKRTEGQKSKRTEEQEDRRAKEKKIVERGRWKCQEVKKLAFRSSRPPSVR